ncbi:MAG: phosphonate C-P lyase system protein PhnG [Candidatus Competibacteraceae bacterium]|nr:phosphonate C-P lyase system protein PhnG [Candidatus Competibacteraceae bacterium]
MNTPSREEWVSALSAVPEETLSAVVNRFPSSWKIQPKALPQAGLGMLKMRDSALGDPFYLGEFPLATCWVTVVTEAGEATEGAALIMDDRVERAEQLALCDAVLSARLPGWRQVAELVEQGAERRDELTQERKSMLARTRVDFSLLDDVGDNDA